MAEKSVFEAGQESVEARLDSIESRLGALEARFDSFESRFEAMLDARLKPVRIDLSLVKHAVGVVLTRLS